MYPIVYDIGACLLPIVLRLTSLWFYELWSAFLSLNNWIAPSVHIHVKEMANKSNSILAESTPRRMQRTAVSVWGNICQQAHHCSGKWPLHRVLDNIWCGGLVCFNATYFCSTTSKSDEWCPRGWHIFPVTPFRSDALSSMTPLFSITCRKLIWHMDSLISICVPLRWIARLV